MRGDTEIGVAVYGRIRTRYLCFIYTPVFTVYLVLEKNESVQQSARAPREFSRSIVYHGATDILPPWQKPLWLHYGTRLSERLICIGYYYRCSSIIFLARVVTQDSLEFQEVINDMSDITWCIPEAGARTKYSIIWHNAIQIQIMSCMNVPGTHYNTQVIWNKQSLLRLSYSTTGLNILYITRATPHQPSAIQTRNEQDSESTPAK